MERFIYRPNALLPEGVSYQKWSVVACDQFTSQIEYWNEVESFVGNAPSTLHMILPEARLTGCDEEERAQIQSIHAAMQACLEGGTLRPATDGYVLTERTTQSGARPGLLVAVDLDQYDYRAGAGALIRATEGTVPSRVPPRARTRRGAPLEIPHVMMLIDDPEGRVIEPLWQQREQMRKLYDFDLMMNGGTSRGYAVEGALAEKAETAVAALAKTCQGMLFAVGDGNHSLAAAKMCWMEIREQLSPAERARHPARYAMVELINLHCPALRFEPIHRIVRGADPVGFMRSTREFFEAHLEEDAPGRDVVLLDRACEMTWRVTQYPLPLLQTFLDEYMMHHPGVTIDYIHGEEALRRMVAGEPDSIGFLVRAFDKSELFETIRRWGALPRKAFSMGEANEKRYYLECRQLG